MLKWIKSNQKKSWIALIFLSIIIVEVIRMPLDIVEDDTKQQGLSVKSFGAIGDGITDDTKAIEEAFNSKKAEVIYFPSGTYKITSTINVKPGKPRLVLGDSDVVISAKLAAGQNLFVLNRNISFENIDFDFNNGFLQYGIYFNADLGEITLKNLKFKNVKDTNSLGGTIVVYILTKGNQVNVSDIHFEDMLKKGNGVITDWAGNITCLYVKGSGKFSEVAGKIKGVRIKNIHNIDADNNIIHEDTSGIYVFSSESNDKNDIEITNVYGYNFGKRLIKLDASNVKIKKVFAYSDTNDALSAILVYSGEGEGNNIITDVKIRGGIYAALVAAGSNTIFRDIDIKLEKTTFSGENPNTGILIMTEDVLVEKVDIEAERPIFLQQNSNSVKPLKNTRVKDTTFYVPVIE
ncbi:pectate lyase-like protein [Peribacillus frigoritolerans]|uniref:glycosyl hydrolase family 28-related protein n=1 Tax=Peribacillus frigoritolerans TaxID=450367 RepID=UPI00119B47E2|nr:glycosyl hydrolase family 28-related protein [Peribacillus frigoritolerans]TWE04182.1 pectate lyase-like protein [Peribacillus frigoritolerans]